MSGLPDPATERHPPMTLNAHIFRTVRVDLATLETGTGVAIQGLNSLSSLNSHFSTAAGTACTPAVHDRNGQKHRIYRLLQTLLGWQARRSTDVMVARRVGRGPALSSVHPCRQPS